MTRGSNPKRLCLSCSEDMVPYPSTPNYLRTEGTQVRNAEKFPDNLLQGEASCPETSCQSPSARLPQHATVCPQHQPVAMEPRRVAGVTRSCCQPISLMSLAQQHTAVSSVVTELSCRENWTVVVSADGGVALDGGCSKCHHHRGDAWSALAPSLGPIARSSSHYKP